MAAVAASSAFAALAGQAGAHGNGIGGGGGPTPFAGLPPNRSPEGQPAGGPGPPASAPSFNLANLSSLFGGDITRLPQLAGQLNLPNFPSIPAVSAGRPGSCSLPVGGGTEAGGPPLGLPELAGVQPLQCQRPKGGQPGSATD